MKFKWKNIKKPIFILAPMAEITTLPFRSICHEYGADIVFTPMLSANAIIHNPKKTLKIAEFLPKEQPVIVQIFGYDGTLIAKAANIVHKELKPAGIDINMGCPAPKITGNECGSGLLKDYDKALEVVKKVREDFSGQLSVKIRLGWKDFDVLPFIKELEKIGIDAVSIHGRTAKQGYRGEADWEKIYEIAKNVSIPVIGNGDVTTWEKAHERLKGSTLSGIMIGRGALGKPWIFKEIKRKKKIAVNGKQLKKIILKQTKLTIKYLGDEDKAIREMRKHYGWYLKGFPGASELRKSLIQAEDYNQVKKLLNEFCS